MQYLTPFCIAAAAFGSFPLSASAADPIAPLAERRPFVHSEHGIPRPDDYHWLKQKKDPAVRAYLEAENLYAESFFKGTSTLEAQLLAELKARVVDDDSEVPMRRGKYVYYTRYPSGKDFEVVCRKPAAGGAEEVLLDHNLYVKPGTPTYLYGSAVAGPDDRLMAWKENHDGTDVFRLRIRDVVAGQNLPDEIPGTAFMMPPVWANDGKTLFYTEPDATQRSFRVKRHTLGQPVASAVTLYEEKDTRFDVRLEATTDRKHLLIQSISSDSTEIRTVSLDAPAEPATVFAVRRPGIRYGVTHHEGSWYIMSNDGGTNGLLLKTVDGATEASHWQPVWAYDDSVAMESVHAFEKHVVVEARQKGVPGMYVLTPRTMERRWMTAPVEGASFYAETPLDYDSPVQRVSYESFTTPPTIADIHLDDGRVEILKQKVPPSGFDPAKYEVVRTAARAEDGVEIPIWLVLPANRKKDQPIPIILEGYGSYGSSNDPVFSANQLSLLDRGIGVGVAQIRGGGEFGRTWHEAGKVLNKETTLKDYVTCAQHLVTAGYTAPDRLIGYGVSAGGLVAGYAINTRPDLFRGFIADVPFVDALNTQFDPSIPLVTVEYEEWGNPTIRAHYDVLRRYMPYENIRRQAYPALMVTAGWNDPRVMYWEPAKWVARLRAHHTGDQPIVLLTKFDSGHGGTSGRYGHLNDVARKYAFILRTLGL